MNDYAVIKTGGKQYLVEQGAKISVEKLEGKPGEKITFDDVVLKEPKEILEDLIVAAHNDAKLKLKREKMEAEEQLAMI